MMLSEVEIGQSVIVDDPDISDVPFIGTVVDIDVSDETRAFTFIDVEYLETTGTHKGAVWPLTDYFLSCNLEKAECQFEQK